MRNVKRTLFILLFLALSFQIAAADAGYDVFFSQPTSEEYELEFKLGNYWIDETTKGAKTYSVIDFEAKALTTKKGFAELPFLSAAVQISADTDVSLQVVETQYIDHRLGYPLLPSRGVIYRNQDPSTIPYEISEESIVDKWYPGTIAENSEPFILRDVRGVNIFVYPFQYNAKERVLRVYTKMVVRLVEEGETTLNLLKASSSPVLAVMDKLYRSLFINYDPQALPKSIGTQALAMGEVGDLLVIHTSRDAYAIWPYVLWKSIKGLTVKTRRVPEGTNVKDIIKQEYNANSNLLYVQLVGDWEDIQSDTHPDGGPMDPMLGCVAGTDNYPDIIIGRFSAKNPFDVIVQIVKAINYEKNPSFIAGWYHHGLGIASGEGPGDDGEYDYQHSDVIKEYKLLKFTYTNVIEAYTDPPASLISSAVNDGVSIINYTGHGSHTSWGTSGFSNSDISALYNWNKLPFIVSVACVNGEFHTGEDCFAEAWLKKPDGGAVATWMSTINQPWNPPMIGQDYFNDLLIGGYDYSQNPGNGTSTTEGRTTFGSLCFNAGVLMYSEDHSSSSLDTLQTWTIFGDASVQVRTDTPKPINLSNTTVSAGSPFTTKVTSGASPVEDALVSLYQNGNSYSGLTNSAGEVTIEHSLSPGAASLVVTGFNLETECRRVYVYRR